MSDDELVELLCPDCGETLYLPPDEADPVDPKYAFNLCDRCNEVDG